MSEIPSGIARKRLSEDVIARYKEAFDLIDNGGNGTIDKSELKQFGEIEGVGQFSEEEVKSVLNTYGGENGVLEFEELLDFIYLSHIKSLENIFQNHAGEDGKLSKEEYAKMMRGIGMPDETIDSLFELLDSDKTGTVTKEEMVDQLLSLPSE
jgi:Ca2+-binding EF-hand superfamily protein